MNYTVDNISRKVSGEIHPPASKSISNRALILRYLSGKKITIENCSDSDDTVLLKRILSSLGDYKSGINEIDCRNAGTVFRFLLPILSVTEGHWLLTGSERMKARPVGPLVKALNELGANIQYLEKPGFAPLSVRGTKLTGKTISINASESSQFVSALLLIAHTLVDGLEINLEGGNSSLPYITMTLKLLESAGIVSEFSKQSIRIKKQSLIPFRIKVESDWSAASYWYEMAALSQEANLVLHGYSPDSLQGDSEIRKIMEHVHVHTEFTKEGIHITKLSRDLTEKKQEYHLLHFPDLFPALLATCCGLRLPCDISGIKNLRIKESDRIESLKTELAKTGCLVHVSENDFVSLSFQEEKTPSGIIFGTHDDHRIAMSLAPLALIFGKVKIQNPDVVSKSYPAFWSDFESAGFRISEE